MKVYLCGPINGRSDDDCVTWRQYAKNRLLDTIDPMRRDYRGRELEPGIAGEIVTRDIADIEKCDALLVYYDKPSVGTAMEIRMARAELGKRIVLVDRSHQPLSPWLIWHCHEIYKSLDEAIESLK